MNGEYFCDAVLEEASSLDQPIAMMVASQEVSSLRCQQISLRSTAMGFKN
jgi:hypothetical protein